MARTTREKKLKKNAATWQILMSDVIFHVIFDADERPTHPMCRWHVCSKDGCCRGRGTRFLNKAGRRQEADCDENSHRWLRRMGVVIVRMTEFEIRARDYHCASLTESCVGNQSLLSSSGALSGSIRGDRRCDDALLHSLPVRAQHSTDGLELVSPWFEAP